MIYNHRSDSGYDHWCFKERFFFIIIVMITWEHVMKQDLMKIVQMSIDKFNRLLLIMIIL